MVQLASVQPSEQGLQQQVGAGATAAGQAGEWYQYQVAFVDLDMKPLAKIPKHFDLDQRIMQAAQQHHGESSTALQEE